MQIHSATFIKSHASYDTLKESELPEFAFVGRSNVGKSSLINMIAGGKKDLATVSSRPGRTQLINEFLMNKTWNLIDLPGYGYAKTSKSQQGKFQVFVTEYLLNRENLKCVFALIDSKIPPQALDLQFTEWLMESNIPFVLVFTKADKSKPGAVQKNVDEFLDNMLNFCDVEGLPRYYVTSSSKFQGRRDVMDFINSVVEANK